MIIRLKHEDLPKVKGFEFTINGGLFSKLMAEANKLGLENKRLLEIKSWREPDKGGIIYVFDLITEDINEIND